MFNFFLAYLYYFVQHSAYVAAFGTILGCQKWRHEQ